MDRQIASSLKLLLAERFTLLQFDALESTLFCQGSIQSQRGAARSAEG